MKTLYIEIGDCNKIKPRGVVDKLMRKVAKDNTRIIFANIEYFSQALTKNHLEWLQLIRELQPQSVDDLAKLMKRRKSDVSRTINHLADNGFIELRRMPQQQVMPIVHYSNIIATMPIDGGT